MVLSNLQKTPPVFAKKRAICVHFMVLKNRRLIYANKYGMFQTGFKY
jgi:hypothetical protein